MFFFVCVKKGSGKRGRKEKLCKAYTVYTYTSHVVLLVFSLNVTVIAISSQ